MNNGDIRTIEYKCRRTLKDGTVAEYTYNRSYTKKTNIVQAGKTKLIRRITDCKDVDKLRILAEWMDNNGM